MTTRLQARVVTLSEIILQASTPDGIRFAASRTLDATFGGGEANVAMSLARSGIPAALAGALLHNDLGEAARAFLRGGGVDDACIVDAPGRMLKSGAVQRASRVLHDRAEL